MPEAAPVLELRGISKTAPYFHDGSVAELDRAVRIMGEVQLGTSLDELTIGNIVAFLNSLTGEIPPNYGPPGHRTATIH